VGQLLDVVLSQGCEAVSAQLAESVELPAVVLLLGGRGTAKDILLMVFVVVLAELVDALALAALTFSSSFGVAPGRHLGVEALALVLAVAPNAAVVANPTEVATRGGLPVTALAAAAAALAAEVVLPGGLGA